MPSESDVNSSSEIVSSKAFWPQNCASASAASPTNDVTRLPRVARAGSTRGCTSSSDSSPSPSSASSSSSSSPQDSPCSLLSDPSCSASWSTSAFRRLRGWASTSLMPRSRAGRLGPETPLRHAAPRNFPRNAVSHATVHAPFHPRLCVLRRSVRPSGWQSCHRHWYAVL